MNYFGLPELPFLLVGGIIIILPLWKVFSKAGYPGALSLGMILPVVNIILLYFRVQRLAGAEGVEGFAYISLRRLEEEKEMSKYGSAKM